MNILVSIIYMTYGSSYTSRWSALLTIGRAPSKCVRRGYPALRWIYSRTLKCPDGCLCDLSMINRNDEKESSLTHSWNIASSPLTKLSGLMIIGRLFSSLSTRFNSHFDDGLTTLRDFWIFASTTNSVNRKLEPNDAPAARLKLNGIGMSSVALTLSCLLERLSTSDKKSLEKGWPFP